MTGEELAAVAAALLDAGTDAKEPPEPQSRWKRAARIEGVGADE